MNNLKRILYFTIAVFLFVTLTACGSSTADPGHGATDPTPSGDNTEPGKVSGILVVWFSATGNTGAVAGYISQALDADTLELKPKQAYTSADLKWGDSNSRVSREHSDESLRDVELERVSVDNWDEYDTVFIGYPIWWGIAAWPVNSFIKANDFTGKTVIPFCTSASSGMGQSGKLLAEMAGTGTWYDGMRFGSNADRETATGWIRDLGIEK